MRKLCFGLALLVTIGLVTVSGQAAGGTSSSFVIMGVEYNDGLGNPKAWQNFPNYGTSSGQVQVPLAAVGSPIVIYGYYTPPAASTLITGTVDVSSSKYSPPISQAPVQATDGSGGWRITIPANTIQGNTTNTINTYTTPTNVGQMVVAGNTVTVLTQTLLIASK